MHSTQMKKIKITGYGGSGVGRITRGYALVDDSDFKSLSKLKWRMTTHGYAVTGRPVIYMHALINKTPKGKVTDHINQNKLDNRKSNLRTTDKSINAINTKLRKTNTSGYKGVSWNKLCSLWEAYIGKNNTRIRLGLFKKLRDAVEARRQAELIYHNG